MNPDRTWWDRTTDALSLPLNYVGDFVFDNAVGDAVSRAVQGIVSLINDGVNWTVQPDLVYREFQQNGYPSVCGPADVFRLDLQQADEVLGYLAAKYKLMAAAEGAVSGAGGAAGIVADIPALIGINLRGIAEYTVYYGFDPQSMAERRYVMSVLTLVSSPTNAAKYATLAELRRIALAVARRTSWQELEKSLVVTAMQQVAKVLGIRLTKAKLGQLIPVLGAIIGGGYNAWYTGTTTEAAFNLYRLRFLAAKYGEDILNC